MNLSCFFTPEILYTKKRASVNCEFQFLYTVPAPQGTGMQGLHLHMSVDAARRRKIKKFLAESSEKTDVLHADGGR
jgi:hypothetical protein